MRKMALLPFWLLFVCFGFPLLETVTRLYFTFLLWFPEWDIL
jgi:hypothetical protein